MDKDLRCSDVRVTIIVPCYNMGEKIHRMLDSLLSQSIHCFKIFVIDDGSKDNSREVVKSYKEKFSSIGVELNYIFQSNGGVSEAVNNGLKRVDTDFFCLPDADDFLAPTYMQEFMDYFDRHEDCGIVFSMCNVFHVSDRKNPVGVLQRKDEFKQDGESLCKDFIWGTNVYYCPDYMIRTKDFIRANGSLEIENGRYGQNYQMLLPMVYHSKCGYINKPLYNYIIYRQSISHGKRTLLQHYASFDGGTKSLHETIKKMNLPSETENSFHKIVDQKNAIQKADKACEYGNKQLFEQFFQEIAEDFLSSSLRKIYDKRNTFLFFYLVTKYKRTKTAIRNSTLIYKIKILKNLVRNK